MPKVKLRATETADRTAYHLVRRAQAAIAGYLHFGAGDLVKYLDREAFNVLVARLVALYFHRSVDLAIFTQVRELYHALLILAPILQRLPLSCKFDWHRGHHLGFMRRNASGKSGRFHVATREVQRCYQPDLLAANLEQIGIHDGGMALKDLLAHQLFDPILMASQKQGFELRYGNRLLRMERNAFDGSVDLRCQSITVLDFEIQSILHNGGRHLDIGIAAECIVGLKRQIDEVLALAAPPEFKLIRIENLLRDFVERTRAARSALPQIKELKAWLARRLRGLAGTRKEATALPNLLVNLWLQRADSHLYLKKPTFFLDYAAIDEKTYLQFFSPYREV